MRNVPIDDPIEKKPDGKKLDRAMPRRFAATWMAIYLAFGSVSPVASQTPPNRTDIRSYKGLLSSVIREDIEETRRLLLQGANPDQRDDNGTRR